MSRPATIWAWEQSLKPLDKMVLLNLADRANENFECWPSMQTIADDCGLCRKSVFNSIVKLEQNKMIFVERRTTSHGKSSNIYTISMTRKQTKRACVRDTHQVVHHIHIEPNSLDNIPY
jgi:predicted transcriptional regulator